METLPLALLLTLAGCGSGGDGSGSSAAPTSAGAAASSAIPTPTKDDALAAKVPQSVSADGKIVFGTDASYPPNEFTAPDGTKLGKTTGARTWLDPARTSPYQFFQHWMQTDDRLVAQMLAQFTLLPVAEVAGAVAMHEQAPERRSAQRLLAREVTTLVHGAVEAAAAEAAAAAERRTDAPGTGAHDDEGQHTR